MILISALLLVFVSRETRYLLAPVVTVISIAVVYTTVLWDRDRRLPVFEVGTLWVAATVVYSVIPLLGFVAMDGQWGTYTDSRLLSYDFDARELGGFGWRGAVYVSGFVIAYLVIRGRRSARGARLEPIRSQRIAALVTILFLQYAFKWAMAYGYGLNTDIAYTDLANLVAKISQTPLLVLQITFQILASILVAKQAVLLLMMQRWQAFTWRLAIGVWLTLEFMIVVVRRGARTEAILLLLTFALLYDRFVRPLRARVVITGGIALLITFLVLGHIRGFLTLRDVGGTTMLTTSNEFQVLFGTAFDLFKRKQLGTLGSVPWQIYASDLYLLIPQQLLPFEKIDPSTWYLSVIGARDTGVGFMFGVMSQAVLGLDWLELALRGLVLGTLLAMLHRWYVRRAESFWVTLLYLFVAIWTYYTYRATSFWITHLVVYEFLPLFLVAVTFEHIFSRSTRRERSA